MTKPPRSLIYDGYMEAPTSKQNTMNSVIFFDGVCHLCDGLVKFVLRWDRKQQFLFAPLQGETAKKYLPAAQIETLSSLALYENGNLYYRSEAVRRICRHLPSWRWLAYVLAVIPLPVRNWAYDKVAANRYRWFGKMESCRLPQPGERERFLV